jgi:hypothetical protein
MAITISGSGIVEANLADNAVTLAKMASGTDGEILTYDASGNPVAVSVGTDGQVLTSTGVGSPPAFEAAAAGGKVLQAVSSSYATSESTTSTAWQNSGLNISITPSATSSKILLIYTVTAYTNSYSNTYTTLFRGNNTGTILSGADAFSRLYINYGGAGSSGEAATVLDSPNTTSAQLYTMCFKSSGTSYVQYGGVTSTLLALEIGA